MCESLWPMFQLSISLMGRLLVSIFYGINLAHTGETLILRAIFRNVLTHKNRHKSLNYYVTNEYVVFVLFILIFSLFSTSTKNDLE